MTAHPAEFAAALKGKRIVLVGPAGYLEGRRRGAWIDSFDVVAKMNWGETLPEEDYGRTDVLFKRLLKLGHADEPLVQQYLEAGLKWLVAVETRANAPRAEILDKILGERVPWFIDTTTRRIVHNELKSAPLLGIIATRILLELEVESVTIAGCDFYATGYSPDYGGKPYRKEMARREGTIGGRHDGPEQLRYLVQLRAQDDRLHFDDELEALAAAIAPRPGAQTAATAPQASRTAKRAAKAASRARDASAGPSGRFTWTTANVSAIDPAAMAVRTFIEHHGLAEVLHGLDLAAAAELGAGWGRMGQKLAELAGAVTLYEREPALAAAAARLLPELDVVQVPRLDAIPAPDGAFDLVMSFTVLQHMSDEAARQVVEEMGRLADQRVLIVEDTNPEYRRTFKREPSHFTIGRSVDWYVDALGDGFKLEQCIPREVEPGYKGQSPAFVGAYMLFVRV